MLRATLIAAAVAFVGELGGCAAMSAGWGDTSPYAGRHDHNRDAKQGTASPYVPSAPVRRSSLRPAW
jgi:hypothetical protein